MNIRIVLADDHAVVRDGIKAIVEKLGEGIKVIAEASNGQEVLEIAQKNRVDVYVLDISMPLLNGIETIERLKKIRPQAKAVILSMYDDKILVEQAFKKGARGYILKENVAEDVVRAIREVHRGKYYVSPSISGYLIQGFLSERPAAPGGEAETALTTRQREILKLICDGLNEKEIARQLNISPHTVHVHKNNIMSFLGLHTKAELIKYAIRTGIVQL